MTPILTFAKAVAHRTQATRKVRVRSPRIPFLRRRSGQAFTAFCDGALLLAAAVFFLPSRPWIGSSMAVAATLPGWLNAALSRRSARRVFAPDPLAPDFAAFRKAFIASTEEAASPLGGRVEWTLCPFRDAGGAYIPYSIDIMPARGEVRIGPATGAPYAKTETLIRPRLPLPVTVCDTPVTIGLSPASARRQVFMDSRRLYRMPWNNPDGNLLGADAAKLWPAMAFALAAACPGSSVFAVERLALVAFGLVFLTLRATRR